MCGADGDGDEDADWHKNNDVDVDESCCVGPEYCLGEEADVCRRSFGF